MPVPARVVMRAAALLGTIAAATSHASSPAPAWFVRQIPWIGHGVWLRADLHAHTTFSDGAHTPDELVAKAGEHGCDVAAITDHGDSNLKAATPAYVEAILAARQTHPRISVITGLEWNIPPAQGHHHVTMLVPQALDDAAVLAEFKSRFDDFQRENTTPELADAAFRWIAARTAPSRGPVFFLNHPSRKLAKSDDVRPSLERWRGASEMFLGIEGAPGHQHQTPLGAYGRAIAPIDRWDPISAQVGGIWDQLLGQGVDLWGASATSDFHSWENGDYWPCQFSETRIYARDRTLDGAIDALRAGSFFGVHGRVVSDATLTVTAAGLPRPAVPGEVIRVATGGTVTVGLSVRVPEVDWEGAPNRIDRIEIIGADRGGARVITTTTAPTTETRPVTLAVPAGGLVVRGRGCRVMSGSRSLCFYTNPVRIVS